MMDAPPPYAADHAEDFARRYERDLDAYCAIRMEELGLPEHLHGTPDLEGDGMWRAFIPRDRQGGSLLSGIAVNSGCLNPELLNGRPGGRAYAEARLRDRIDAIIAHEFEEDRLGSHEASLKHAMKTALPICEGARRILKAMARAFAG